MSRNLTDIEFLQVESDVLRVQSFFKSFNLNFPVFAQIIEQIKRTSATLPHDEENALTIENDSFLSKTQTDILFADPFQFTTKVNPSQDKSSVPSLFQLHTRLVHMYDRLDIGSNFKIILGPKVWTWFLPLSIPIVS